MYVRNYGSGLGLGRRRLFRHGSAARWRSTAGANRSNGSGRAPDCAARQVRAAIRRHPVTGEPVWFNHALFFHFTSLPEEARKSILAAISYQVPCNTFFGDGRRFRRSTWTASAAPMTGIPSHSPGRREICSCWTRRPRTGASLIRGERRMLTIMAEPFRVDYDGRSGRGVSAIVATAVPAPLR